MILNSETKAVELPEHHGDELRLWLRLLTCTTLIEGEVRSRLRERFDVTLPRFDLMAQLDKVPEGMTLSDVSKRMMVSNGNVTGLVERLVESGHLDRRTSDADRRVQVIRLTKAGRAEFRKMAAEHELWIADVFGDLTPKDVRDLMRLLGQDQGLGAEIRKGAGGLRLVGFTNCDRGEDDMAALEKGITANGTGYGGKSWNILGQVYFPKAVTNSTFAFETNSEPGQFVPVHIHPTQDEFILVQEGVLDLKLDGVWVQAKAGDLVRLPRGIPHGYFNKSDKPARALFWVSPMQKLEALFNQLHNLTDPEEVVRISAQHEVDFLPPEANE